VVVVVVENPLLPVDPDAESELMNSAVRIYAAEILT
jgi:hypothetical protein